MRIVQVAPLFESVPPKLYGGTERIVHFLTEELVRLGHEVTLYAAGDSVTSARLVSVCPRALRLDGKCVDPVARHLAMLERLSQDYRRYDIIHFHIDYLHFGLARALGWPQLTTLHNRLDIPDLESLYDVYPDMPLVSISNAQQAPLPRAHWIGTVLHGLPPNLLTFTPEPQGYLAFVGRMSPEKGPDRAIDIALALGERLRLAAKIGKEDERWFREQVEPRLEHPLLEFVGEIDEAQKSAFLGGARALLFPIGWPEPFGLVMIEAMACGTPVIAFDHGSVREVIEDGVTGFIVSDVPSAIEAAREARRLDRRRIRREFERRFTVKRMANEYLKLYASLATPSLTRRRRAVGA